MRSFDKGGRKGVREVGRGGREKKELDIDMEIKEETGFTF